MVAGCIIPLLLLAVSGCSPGYVLRAGWEEASILLRRKDITKLIDDPEIDPELKRKLRLVLDARSYAKQQGLEPGGSYTQYSKIDRDVLVWVLGAAPQSSFQPYTWWFPIVGSVPYKGFFEKEDGIREAEELRAEGFDVFLRPSPAFSTLGWFNDPLLSTVVAFDDVALVNTVIHEILHNTIWIPNHVSFNETLANVVGALGAQQFFEGRRDTAAALADEAAGRFEDELLFARFLATMEQRLSLFYDRYDDTPLTDERRDALRKERSALFAELQQEWKDQSSRLHTKRFVNIDAIFNNAAIVAYKLYLDRPWLFVELYHRSGGSIPQLMAAVAEIKKQAKEKGSNPYTELENMLRMATPAAN